MPCLVLYSNATREHQTSELSSVHHPMGLASVLDKISLVLFRQPCYYTGVAWSGVYFVKP